MLGVILCGGKSTRMGSDKGLLKLENKTWAQTAVDKLATLQIPIKLSINKNQYNDYAAVFSPSDLITDDETLQLGGPLAGTLSAHLQNPDEDIFILGCDMLLMEPFLLKELLQSYQSDPLADAFVFTNDGEPEPLCSIYKVSGLAAVLAMYHSQQLTKHSMKFMLYHIKMFTIPITEDHKKYFRNFNAYAELNGL
jgi:molybdopterin-guanine dinucleotide biosynthesis protein A